MGNPKDEREERVPIKTKAVGTSNKTNKQKNYGHIQTNISSQL